ncbi:unnamed protein product, partial [Soboliphyme baturini]|uniref:C2H2-type domain-containing protein n=1 Tax=Soboliphyme baturini TaxID=241478 RepID=A0A183JAD9_9BILA
YIEYWRHRFGETAIDKIFPRVVPAEDDPGKGVVDSYYLMSPKLQEDLQIRERLALRRLEEVLSCQQRERLDRSFDRVCLFCRYRVKGNRSKLIHHLYLIHQLNLGSPDNLVFVNEYLDLLASKIRECVEGRQLWRLLHRFCFRNQCIYCENTFENHESLMEHMRKKQHREVNPKNLYYDKFYVINYLVSVTIMHIAFLRYY